LITETQAPTTTKKNKKNVNNIHAIGKRKSAVARVFLKPGDGKIIINGVSLDRYLPVGRLIKEVKRPLDLAKLSDKYDVYANVKGGGITGQADGIKLGIARCLLLINEGLKSELRKAGLLTRDPREKERKKYGLKRARRGFQWAKR